MRPIIMTSPLTVGGLSSPIRAGSPLTIGGRSSPIRVASGRSTPVDINIKQSSGRSTPVDISIKSGQSTTPTPNDVSLKSDCVNIYIITDDKSKQNHESGMEAKQVDDRFREILLKRKGEFLHHDSFNT